MEADEILRKAWEAVEKAGLPESMHEAAFREAVEILKDPKENPTAASTSNKGRQKSRSKSTSSGKASQTQQIEVPDDDTFFSRLAKESGVPEGDIRDILMLSRDGTVRVTTATRELGDSLSQQARTVVALVASARSVGLEERPVNTAAVRTEVARKRCLDRNFARWVLGELRGFNAVGRTEIAVTRWWVDEFQAAVDQAHGRATGEAT